MVEGECGWMCEGKDGCKRCCGWDRSSGGTVTAVGRINAESFGLFVLSKGDVDAELGGIVLEPRSKTVCAVDELELASTRAAEVELCEVGAN